MLDKSKQRLFLKKGEWCASSFLLLNTVKQSESSYLASSVRRAVVPQKVNNDQDLWLNSKQKDRAVLLKPKLIVNISRLQKCF